MEERQRAVAMVWCGPVSQDIDLDTGRSIGVGIRPKLQVDEALTDDDLNWINAQLDLAEAPRAVRLRDLIPPPPRRT